MDVVLKRTVAGEPGGPVPVVGKPVPIEPWSRYVNHPLKGLVAARLVDPLQRHLNAQLPEYMVPAAIVVLDALPVTPNGKLDRRALPAPDLSRSKEEGDFIAPRDSLERELAGIWEEILGVRPIGVRDNFFLLGGHSLSVVRMTAQVQNRLGCNVPLASLLQGGTIEHLASTIRGQHDSAQSPLVAIQPAGSKLPFFCVHAGGNVLCYQELGRLLGPERPVFALQDTATSSPHAAHRHCRGDGRPICCRDPQCPAAGALSPGWLVDGWNRGLRNGRSARGQGGTGGPGRVAGRAAI